MKGLVVIFIESDELEKDIEKLIKKYKLNKVPFLVEADVCG